MSTHLHDVPNATVVAAAFPPAVITDTATGSAVDLSAGDGPCFAIQLVGAVSADGTMDSGLEQSADGTTWTTITDAVFGPVSATGVQTIRFTRSARYVRWSGTPDGPSVSIAVAVVIGQEKKLF